MKGTRSLAPFLGAAVLSGLVGGCSKDNSSNPAPVTVDELKYPGALAIHDLGNGKVSLSWTASNNETAFDGFNVYGMHSAKGDGSELTANGQPYDPTKVAPIELLDSDGNAIDGAKSLLAAYDYDPAAGKKIETAGTPPAAPATTGPTTGTSTDTSSDTPEIQALPIHAVSSSDATKALLPTCKVKAPSMACTLTTDANAGKAVSDDTSIAANGTITYDVSQTDTLKVGETYCFTVMSSEKQGAKISQTSSNVACVTPQYMTSFLLPTPSDRSENYGFDLNEYVKECNAATTGCADPNGNTKVYLAADNAYYTGTSTGAPIHVENSSGAIFLTAAQGNGIADMGYYAGGLSDPNLNPVAPAIKIDSNQQTSSSEKAPILNQGGYASSGQSVPFKTKHVYVIAVQDSTTATKYRYIWLTPTETVTAGSPVTIAVKLPHDAL